MLSEARRASEGRDGAPDRASGAGAGDGDCEPSRMCIAPGDEGREEDVGYDVLMAASRASALMRGLLVRGLPMCDWKRADESRYGESVPGRWCASIGRGDPCGEPGGIPPSPEENLDIECGCAPLGAPAGGGRMGGSRLIVRSMRSVHNAKQAGNPGVSALRTPEACLARVGQPRELAPASVGKRVLQCTGRPTCKHLGRPTHGTSHVLTRTRGQHACVGLAAGAARHHGAGACGAPGAVRRCARQ